MTQTGTFLMFVGEQCGKAEEAVRLYTSLIAGSSIQSVERWSEGEPGGNPGEVKLCTFTLAGNRFIASDSAGPHQFTFTPSFSVFVDCGSEAEMDRLFTSLSEGGQVLMPLDDYGFGNRFGWTSDRYGVSWQINFPA